MPRFYIAKFSMCESPTFCKSVLQFCSFGVFCTSQENFNTRLFSRDGPMLSEIIYLLDVFRNFWLFLGTYPTFLIVHHVSVFLNI